MVMRSTKPLLLASGLLIAPVLAWWALGVTLNHTPSVATGIWYAKQKAPTSPSIGDVVRTCLDLVDHAEYRQRAICAGVSSATAARRCSNLSARSLATGTPSPRPDRGQRRAGARYPAAAGGRCWPVDALGRRRCPCPR